MGEHLSSTCWIAIRGAAAGDPDERDRFARRYAPVVTSYLEARWRRDRRMQDVDDALQEVFIELFREGGALGKADPSLPGGFRAFLYGVTRNVASRVEQRRGRRKEVALETGFSSVVPGDDDGDLAKVFDQAWARSIMKQAWELLERQAEARGESGVRRLRILKLRIEEDVPIRDLAEQWGADATFLHNEYGAARREFKAALREVVEFHVPGARDQVDRECRRLLEILNAE